MGAEGGARFILRLTCDMELRTLSTSEVLAIHDVLVRDFASTIDPISPPGLRSAHLLESAIARQEAGFLGHLKYPGAVENAATLTYGLCQNHPFHNGNKRTALVSLLVHLDRNKLALYNTNQQELYDLMLGIADRSIGLTALAERARRQVMTRRKTDSEVLAISEWLRPRVDRVARGEQLLTYGQLRKCLNRFNYSFGEKRKNSIDVVKLETERYGLLNLRTRQVERRIGNVPYPGEKKDVSIETLKKVRAMCRLCEEDGIDSDAFYFDTLPIDAFVNRYRTALRRLAQT